MIGGDKRSWKIICGSIVEIGNAIFQAKARTNHDELFLSLFVLLTGGPVDDDLFRIS